MGLISFIKKLRMMFTQNANYQKRAEGDLIKNNPWSSLYDRSGQPQDLYGAMEKPRSKIDSKNY